MPRKIIAGGVGSGEPKAGADMFRAFLPCTRFCYEDDLPGLVYFRRKTVAKASTPQRPSYFPTLSLI